MPHLLHHSDARDWLSSHLLSGSRFRGSITVPVTSFGYVLHQHDGRNQKPYKAFLSESSPEFPKWYSNQLFPHHCRWSPPDVESFWKPSRSTQQNIDEKGWSAQLTASPVQGKWPSTKYWQPVKGFVISNLPLMVHFTRFSTAVCALLHIQSLSISYINYRVMQTQSSSVSCVFTPNSKFWPRIFWITISLGCEHHGIHTIGTQYRLNKCMNRCTTEWMRDSKWQTRKWRSGTKSESSG